MPRGGKRWELLAAFVLRLQGQGVGSGCVGFAKPSSRRARLRSKARWLRESPAPLAHLSPCTLAPFACFACSIPLHSCSHFKLVPLLCLLLLHTHSFACLLPLLPCCACSLACLLPLHTGCLQSGTSLNKPREVEITPLFPKMALQPKYGCWGGGGGTGLKNPSDDKAASSCWPCQPRARGGDMLRPVAITLRPYNPHFGGISGSGSCSPPFPRPQPPPGGLFSPPPAARTFLSLPFPCPRFPPSFLARLFIPFPTPKSQISLFARQ